MGLIKDQLIIARSPIKRIGLTNRDFSIIANNCWGGVVSRDRHLPYNSPTCGTYFFSKEYIRFLTKLDYYLCLEPKELKTEDSKYAEELIKRHGREITLIWLDDVEVVCLHYPTFAEAKEKWERRKKRIRKNNLLVKYSDQNLFEKGDFTQFRKLPFKNKLFFTTDESLKSDFTVIIPDRWHEGYAVDDIKSSFRIMSVNKALNSLMEK